MDHRPEAERIDERLARLLDVERGLEARVREAEEAARARVAAARESTRSREQTRETDLEATAHAETEADVARNTAEVRRIAEEGAARIALLSAVPDSVIDRLARRAVAAVLGREEAGRP